MTSGMIPHMIPLSIARKIPHRILHGASFVRKCEKSLSNGVRKRTRAGRVPHRIPHRIPHRTGPVCNKSLPKGIAFTKVPYSLEKCHTVLDLVHLEL